MADAVQKERWNHTAQLLCALYEPHRDKSKRSRPYNAEEFHPFYRKRSGGGRGVPLTKELLREQARQWFADEARKKAAANAGPSKSGNEGERRN